MLQYFDIYRNNVFIKNKETELTYGEALCVIQHHAGYFDQHIDTPTVVFVVPNCLEAQLLMFAALRVRKVVLVNPLLQEITPDIHLQFAPCTVVTFSESPIQCHRLVIDRDSVLKNRQSRSFNDRYQDSSLTLMTSGTTGQSKKVVLSPTEIESYGVELRNYLEFDSHDRILNLLPFYHGFGLTRIFTVLTTGGSQFIPHSNNFKNVIELINHSRTTWVSLIPAQVRLLNQQSGMFDKKFRFATVSASHCDLVEFKKFNDQFGKELLSEYGCTESSIISSNTIKNNLIGSVGIPKPNLVKIQDGEIFTTPAWKESNEMISTGDLGYIDDRGFLWVQGRKKEIIKRNGITLIPQEIENRVKQIPGVTDSVAYVDGTDSRGDLIGIIYTGSADPGSVKKQLKSIFPSLFKSILTIKLVPEIPTTFNKVKRLEIKKYVDQL